MLSNNGGLSTVLIRQSEMETGRTMPLKSKAMANPTTCGPHLQSTQDGGRCSDTNPHLLSTIKER
jgi:hypothetical protein